MLWENAAGDLWGLHEYSKGGSVEPGTLGVTWVTQQGWHENMMISCKEWCQKHPPPTFLPRGSGGGLATYGQHGALVYCAVVTTLNPDRSCGQQPPSALSARAELR